MKEGLVNVRRGFGRSAFHAASFGLARLPRVGPVSHHAFDVRGRSRLMRAAFAVRTSLSIL